MMTDLCEEFKIKHHNSSPYHPKMNRVIEATNKNIKKIIQNMVATYKDWHEMLSFALHGYRTSVRTSTGATPFSLVYGIEVVLPFEVEIPSLRVSMETKLEEAEWVKVRYDQLNIIEEFHEGDLVVKKIISVQKDHRGKWMPNYEGPYVVKKAFSGKALILTRMDGEELPLSVNSDTVKKFYA